jgi:MFS superfamily sulfate permease-like transporter
MIHRLFPFLDWFRDYDRATLRADLVAGLTVALVLVPQSMAYAQLAGLPVYYGLYASFLPPIVASLFGSSRQLATGPVAVVSLMTSAALEPLATAGGEAYVAYALMLSLLVGLFQLSLGVFKLGLVVNFLSHPVVSGFTNAAALIIATSQLSKIFGVSVDKGHHHYETVWRVLEAAHHSLHWPTLCMALFSFAIMLLLRRFAPRTPNILVAVVATTLLAHLSGYERKTTISQKQLESPQVVSLIGAFNQAVATKMALERARSEGADLWQQSDATRSTHGKEATHSLCGRCHAERDPARFRHAPASAPASGATIAPALPPRALALHQRAGLFDLRLAQINQRIEHLRATLRDLRLSRVEEAGQPRFRGGSSIAAATLQALSPGHPPSTTRKPTAEQHNGSWRLAVGRNPLDPSALTLCMGGAVVGAIPPGLPALTLPRIDPKILLRLIAAAAIISLLGFMEAISVAKAIAGRTRQKLDPNQELIGQGLSNLAGCVSLGYPVSGSFSRSAVNLQAGARTGVANVFSGLVVMLVLLFMSGWLYHLPQAVLASIIMLAVFGLIDFRSFLHAWHTNRFDGAVALITFIATLLYAPHLEWGIAIGVTLSLGAYLLRTMRPQVVELAPHASGGLRDARRHDLEACRHLLVFRFEGPLNFVSASHLESEMLNRVADFPELEQILISGAGISEIDASGEQVLRQLVQNLRLAGFDVSFSGLSDPLLDVLRNSHLYDIIGDDHFFATRAQAIARLYPESHYRSDEDDCPYRQMPPPITDVSLHMDGSLRDAAKHQLSLCRHIALLRFDGPLTFANSARLEREVLERLAPRSHLRHIVLVTHRMTQLDNLAAEKLCALVQTLRSQGIEVGWSGVRSEVRAALHAAEASCAIDDDAAYPTQMIAIASIYARAHTGSSEANCPLRGAAPRLTELSVHPDGSLRDVESRQLPVCPRIAILRFDGPAFVGRRAMHSEFISWARRRPRVHAVVFAAQGIAHLSSAEADNLLHFVRQVRDAGYRVVMAAFEDEVFDQLGRAGIADIIGLDDIYATEALALARIYADAHGAPCGEECPLQDLLPRITELSLHGDGSLRDARRNHLALCRHIAAIRFDGSLNFATMEYFREELLTSLRQRPEVRSILIAAHTLGRLDAIGGEELVRLVEALRRAGYRVSMSGLNDSVLANLRRMGGVNAIGAHEIFATQVRALEQIHAEAHVGSDESPCPLLEVVPEE